MNSSHLQSNDRNIAIVYDVVAPHRALLPAPNHRRAAAFV